MAKNGSDQKDQTAANIFAGGGEMGARIRETDWSKTPVGAIDAWQESLKTTVRIMLNSRYPMFVWWGAERINIYNDAYVPILGKRHPKALGKPARETWVDIWDVVGPQGDLVINEGRSTWNEELLLVMERNDFTEETYFTFSYSPVIDDFGKVGGLICICTEDTTKVVGRRRLQTLTVLGERTAEAESVEEACQFAAETLAENRADLPFAVIYLLDKENKCTEFCEAAGIEKGANAAPYSIEIGSAADVWNFEKILQTGKSEIITNLGEKFGELPFGTLDEPPQQAIVLPLAKAGKSDDLAGFLVTAISPNLAFDDDYRSFAELVAGHIATAIANARALEDERKRAEALAELDRAKTEFFSNVSHEFRTPLTLMLGNLEEVLRREDTLAESEREQIETAHRNSLRLLKLVNNLLDFSRIEAGRAAARFEPTDLSRLTADLASNFRAGIEKAGLKLKVDCPPLSQAVAVDREMWEKIVLNLLSNAFKFTLHGEIEIALHETDAGVELKVRDTGVGIPADELPNIFQRFHRVRTIQGRTHEGTGIGLSLVQELVNLHQGEIKVASEPGRGTVFTITVPKSRGGEEEKGRTEEKINDLPDLTEKARDNWQSYLLDSGDGLNLESQNDSPVLPLLPFYSSGKILLADDNTDMRGYISRLLVQNGYLVEAVGDGQEALEKLQDSDGQLPDLVLTDVMMPRLDGFQLIEEIRNDPKTREIPVVMLSARAGEESKIEGFEAGADDYLIKPFSARELLARVGSIIELARMRRTVEAEREKYFAVLESVTDAFYALDRDFCFAYVNGRAEQFLGINREQIIGRNLFETFPQSRGTLLEKEFEKAFRENVPVKFEILSPLSQIWFEVQAYPSRDWLMTYVRDIDERKRNEQEREKLLAGEKSLREEAENANRLKDEFLATVSHELLTPLNSMLGWATMVRQNNFDTAIMRRAFEVVERNARNQNQIISDILDVSRIVTGKLNLNLQPVELSSAIAATIDTVRPAADAKRINLITQFESDADLIVGDPDRLQQIIWNLLSNAVKFTPEGGRIEIALRYLNDRAEISVADNGNGIEPEFLPFVFDRFRQADGKMNRRHGGLGLGLAIVRHLTELHGGSVSAESRGAQQGSVFTVRFPLKLRVEEHGKNGFGNSETIAETISSDANGSNKKLLEGLKILVIDDEVDALDLSEYILIEQNAQVLTADSVDEALKIYETESLDAIISDIGMPDKDGLALIREIKARSDGQTRRVPTIALTAYAREEDSQRILQAGFDAYLPKPVEPAQLIETVIEITKNLHN